MSPKMESPLGCCWWRGSDPDDEKDEADVELRLCGEPCGRSSLL